MDDFAARVQSLPQELFDHIYEEVFTAPASTETYITRSQYERPKYLHIDRHSRELSAQSYYGNTTFIFDSDDTSLFGMGKHKPNEEDFGRDNGTWHNLLRWLASTANSHLSMVQEICFITRCTHWGALTSGGIYSSEAERERWMQGLQGTMRRSLRAKGFEAVADALRVELRTRREDGEDDITGS